MAAPHGHYHRDLGAEFQDLSHLFDPTCHSGHGGHSSTHSSSKTNSTQHHGEAFGYSWQQPPPNSTPLYPDHFSGSVHVDLNAAHDRTAFDRHHQQNDEFNARICAIHGEHRANLGVGVEKALEIGTSTLIGTATADPFLGALAGVAAQPVLGAIKEAMLDHMAPTPSFCGSMIP